MAEGLGYRRGGISSLVALLHNKEQREAFEADLIERGLRLRQLGAPEFTVRDALVLLKNLPRSSATARAVHGPDLPEWGVTEHLLANLLDVARWLQWSKTEDGEKNRNHPEPIPRPGLEPEKSKPSFGDSAMSLHEATEWLGWGDEPATAEEA